jgi:mannose-6-phosphate isomerase
VNRVQGVVQHYEWGDEHAIPELLGVAPDGTPWAELWFGTHPNGPSTLDDGRALVDVSGVLGFMIKVLAARRPLSLQAHPDADRAREGHALGIYPDANPKPELLCALTPFDTLCGVRDPAASIHLLGEIGATDLAGHLSEQGVGATIEAIYRGRFDIASTVAACRLGSEPEARLVADLAAEFPTDPSPVVTLLLNRVHLEPTEAILLGPGNLHAYLHGTGVEVMAASDNVVRGGLTTKPVDVDELLRIVDTTTLARPRVAVAEVQPGWFRYATDGAPFELLRVETGPGGEQFVASRHGLALVTAGGMGEWPRGAAMLCAPGEPVDLPPASTLHIASELR